MSTFTFSPHFLTLGDLRSRVVRKIKNDQISDDVDGWINDVVQWLTAEFPQDSLISDGEDDFTGDGVQQVFNLPDDFQHMLCVYDKERGFYLESVSVQAMIEDWQRPTPLVQDPGAYTIVGRALSTPMTQTILPKRIKFDTIPTLGKSLPYIYYRLHHKLVSDDDPLLLDPEIQSLVVDGVLLEADVFNNHEDYDRHERKFYRRLDRAFTRRVKKPSQRVVVGGSPRRGRPAPPVFPPGYP